MRLTKTSSIILLIAVLAGCSSSPPPNAGTGTTSGVSKDGGKSGEKAPTETVKTTSEEDPKVKASAEALEKAGAKLVRREGAVVRVELGPEGSDADLLLLKDLPTVEVLVGDKRGVTDKGLESLAGHPGLKTLDLTLSGITNAGMAHLDKLPKLEEVNLKRCDITAPGYEALAKISTLKRIRARRRTSTETVWPPSRIAPGWNSSTCRTATRFPRTSGRRWRTSKT